MRPLTRLACLATLSLCGCGTDALMSSTDDQGTSNLPDLRSTSGDIAPGLLGDIAVPPKDLAGPPKDFAVPTPVDLAIPANDQALPPGDLVLVGVTCGNNTTCNVGQKCCVAGNVLTCMNSCPDGNFSLGCTGPEGCGGDPCCVVITNGTASGSMCTSSPTSCPPTLNGPSGQTRVCHVDTDCTSGAPNTTLNMCCSLQMNGQTAHICLNQQFAGFLGGTCP